MMATRAQSQYRIAQSLLERRTPATSGSPVARAARTMCTMCGQSFLAETSTGYRCRITVREGHVRVTHVPGAPDRVNRLLIE
jgi:ferric-dicitrate binding protein FerR (iron transport regulator)